MVLICLPDVHLSENEYKISKNWFVTKAKAVGNTIELIIKKKSTKSIETGALMVLLCLQGVSLYENV